MPLGAPPHWDSLLNTRSSGAWAPGSRTPKKGRVTGWSSEGSRRRAILRGWTQGETDLDPGLHGSPPGSDRLNQGPGMFGLWWNCLLTVLWEPLKGEDLRLMPSAPPLPVLGEQRAGAMKRESACDCGRWKNGP